MPASNRSPFLANFALVAFSVFLSLLLLGGLEVGVRIAGLGDDRRTSRLKYQQIHFPTLVPRERADGTPILVPADPRLRYQSILREKPEGTLRVVTFGGSATAGLGFSPNVTFSRELERILETAYPERSVEVLNLGIVALASKQVKLLVEEAARLHAADVMIVYSGNNEFLEVHAEKYAEATSTPSSRLASALMDLNLYRFVNEIIRGPQRGEALQEQEFSNEDLQLTQDAIIQEVSMSEAEIEAVLESYESNIEEMVEVAQENRTPIVLMSVASNWEWRGRSDLPEDWLEDFLGEAPGEGGEATERAIQMLGQRITESDPDERHEWLFKRASLHGERGDEAAARSDYRAAMNADPHLRRALDDANDRLRSVATRRGVSFVDTVEVLAAHAPAEIVGFGEFYDYVHFTPLGNIRLAASLFEVLQSMGVIGRAAGFDLAAYVDERLAAVEALEVDSLAVGDWMGFAFDPSMIADRDLWKYDKVLRELDDRVSANPQDAVARVFRGNGHYFRLGGGADAALDYRAALETDPGNPIIRANLERVLADGREGEGR